MDINSLNKKLEEALKTFTSEICAEYDDYSHEPVVNADISTLARQTFYLVDSFRNEIISYLKDNA